MVRFIVIIAIVLSVGGVLLSFIAAWRERNILRARDEEDKDV